MAAAIRSAIAVGVAVGLSTLAVPLLASCDLLEAGSEGDCFAALGLSADDDIGNRKVLQSDRPPDTLTCQVYRLLRVWDYAAAPVRQS